MKALLFLLILLNTSWVVAQSEEDKIFWQEENLTWNDFKGTPVKDSPFHANTNAGLSYGWSLRQGNGTVELQYRVLSFFNPYSSWVRPQSKSDYLLLHEQLHFDITELHARKLRKILAEFQTSQLGEDPKATLNKIYETIEKERSLMQLKYDKETKHSINKEAQAKWQKFIKTEMEKLSKYIT